MSDAKITPLTEKLARALREVHRQVECGEIDGFDGDVMLQVREALGDFDGAAKVPADGGPLPGSRHYEVHLPGFVDVESTGDLLLYVEAPTAASVRAQVPDYSTLEPLAEVRGADDVDFVIPFAAGRLREHAYRATAQSAPADAVSIHATRAANLLRSLCDSPEAPTLEEREKGRQQALAVLEAVRKNLVARAQIKAHHDRLVSNEQIATHDDFAEVLDMTGVLIPGKFRDLL